MLEDQAAAMQDDDAVGIGLGEKALGTPSG